MCFHSLYGLSSHVVLYMFLLNLLSSLFCIEIGENSEKSNPILSATSHIELEILATFLNMSKLQNWLILLHQWAPLHILAILNLLFIQRTLANIHPYSFKFAMFSRACPVAPNLFAYLNLAASKTSCS